MPEFVLTDGFPEANVAESPGVLDSKIHLYCVAGNRLPTPSHREVPFAVTLAAV
jgi:hypothetical protein